MFSISAIEAEVTLPNNENQQYEITKDVIIFLKP